MNDNLEILMPVHNEAKAISKIIPDIQQKIGNKIEYSFIDDYYIMNELYVKNVQKNHSTLLTINNIKINVGFSDEMFHTKTIKRMPIN